VGVTPDQVAADRALLGPLLEIFVVAEVLKLATWSQIEPQLHHYRDKDQDEVDLMLEDNTGSLVGIEVKAAATVTAADFKRLRKLADEAGKTFRTGMVLYDGDHVIGFDERHYADPLSCLWAT
jgi:predicted AAA+ superfamily ATPase